MKFKITTLLNDGMNEAPGFVFDDERSDSSWIEDVLYEEIYEVGDSIRDNAIPVGGTVTIERIT